jgi:S1-C subfamily serine protease
LFNEQVLSGKTTTVAFLGGTLKNVEGLGDRSAYGLPDETGIIVLSIGNELLKKSGLQEKDVIRTADGKPVKNLNALLDIYQEINWHGKMDLKILRNQQWVKVVLLLK